MAINMDKIREKYNTLKSRGGNSSQFWRPDDGSETTLRIVPTSDGDPFKEFFFHYNVGKTAGFLCPKRNFGDSCRVCEFVSQLFDDGAEDSIKMAKSLTARQRFFSPVFVRGEEDKGVRAWGYGKTVYETLLNLVLNPDYGDITDTDDGTDLVINYGRPPGAAFPHTKIQPRRHNSALSDTSETTSELLESVPDFDSLFDRKTSTAVAAILDEFLSSDEAAESTSSETTQYSSGPQATGSQTTSVDAAFSELLGS
ncbi:hypothetical protein CL634_10920 [bacterium]|nr:hypothetical protein [bacterium]